MKNKVFYILVVISGILLFFVFYVICIIAKPNISLLDFGTLRDYNETNFAINILFDLVIPFGCAILILLPIVIYYNKKNKY